MDILRSKEGQTGPADSACVFEASMSLCGETLARAHARSLDPALLSGYLGDEGESFVESVVMFARAYADQSERDHERLVRAIRKGNVPSENL